MRGLAALVLVVGLTAPRTASGAKQAEAQRSLLPGDTTLLAFFRHDDGAFAFVPFVDVEAGTETVSPRTGGARPAV